MRDDDREQTLVFSGLRLCWQLRGSFRVLAHESCIKGANHASVSTMTVYVQTQLLSVPQS